MSQSTKFRVIKAAIEEERDGTDYLVSAQEAAAKEIGIGRTIASKLDNHEGDVLTRASKIVRLDAAFERRAPDLGSPKYQGFWKEIKRALDKGATTSPDEETVGFLDGYVIPLAFYYWAPKALDESEDPATRLLYGRMAEKVLFDIVFKFARLRKRLTLTDLDVEDAQAMGLRVVAAIADLLLQHSGDPPTGLFNQAAAPAARRRGYRYFRTRMFADHVGWRGVGLASDQARADVYATAYATGLADDLMWLSSIEKEEIAHPNNAWNLVFHAGDWETSARFGARFFVAHPGYLTGAETLLSKLPEDRSVWPGLAAVLAFTNIAELDRSRELLLKRRKDAPEMMDAVIQMIPGILANLSYLDVLNLGDAK